MVDIFMACAVVVLMAYPLTGNAVHEIWESRWRA